MRNKSREKKSKITVDIKNVLKKVPIEESREPAITQVRIENAKKCVTFVARNFISMMLLIKVAVEIRVHYCWNRLNITFPLSLNKLCVAMHN